jgi:protein-S-isoprenylcysteine O-methyltransferase Ste14
LSISVAWLTKTSIRNFHSHGFYRFFAFITIIAIILINLDYWFEDPISLLQIVSWFLLVLSLYFGINGIRLLKKMGKPGKKRIDHELLSFEKTTELVTVGIYRYIRHPMYSSLLFLSWGTFLKHPSWLSIFLVVCSTLFLSSTAKREEEENINYFGTVYQDYMNKTKMFIPLVW